jgi:hypothetical protein
MTARVGPGNNASGQDREPELTAASTTGSSRGYALYPPCVQGHRASARAAHKVPRAGPGGLCQGSGPNPAVAG